MKGDCCKNNKILSRYTDITSLIHILRTKTLTLLGPQNWDDKNDVHYMEQYKDKKGIKSLLALCFTEASETYHHWKVFAPSGGGVRIGFDREELIRNISSKDGFKHGKVEYKKIKDLGENRQKLKTDELPFIKRYPFKPEKKYRILFEDMNEEIYCKYLGIDLSLIKSITLNHWMPKVLVKPVKETIKGINKGVTSEIKVFQTTLCKNEKWKKEAESSI